MSRHGAHEHAVVLPSLKSSAPGCGWQSRLAEEANRQTTEELEREASALPGHAAFILESIDRSQRGGRYIRPEDMVRYVTDFLHERYPGSQIEYEADSTELFSINLSAKARDALGSADGQLRGLARGLRSSRADSGPQVLPPARVTVPPWPHASTMIQWRQPSARAWLRLDWFASADADCNDAYKT